MSLTEKFSRLKTYPYTNARVRAMRANLVSDSEYRKLAKMSLSEIAEFLGNRGYGREMEELGAEYEGEELIERVLKRNLSNTYMKLIRISPTEVEALMQAYYRKFEVQNLKTLLRKQLRETEEDITEILIPTPSMDRGTLQRYLEMSSVDEVLDKFTIQSFDGNLQDALKDADSLQEMEDTLDAHYYMNLEERAHEAGVSSKLFTRFLQIETALLNITLILRMKRRDYGYEDILDRLVEIPTRLQIVDNEQLAQTDSYETALDMLRESKIGDHLTDGVESPAEISRALQTYKLEKGIEMLHTGQLTINPILGFMVCKEIEVSNLRMIVRAKEEDLSEDFIERNLVTGVTN